MSENVFIEVSITDPGCYEFVEHLYTIGIRAAVTPSRYDYVDGIRTDTNGAARSVLSRLRDAYVQA